MTTPTREAIMSALFTLVSGSAGYVLAQRNWVHWTKVNQQDRPALFMAESDEQYTEPHQGTPTKTIMTCDLFIYGWVKDVPVPSSVLNPLLDAIDTVLAGSVTTGRVTLGGLVTHVWIDGKILKVPGYIDGNAIAVVPIKILVP